MAAMSPRQRQVVFVAFVLLSLVVWPAGAQVVIVTDPAVTIRNALTAVLEEYVFNVQREQRRQIRRMARRLSLFTDLAKYVVTDTPRWRIHNFQDVDAVLFARDYHAALNYGDGSGTAYRGVTEPLLAADDEGVLGQVGDAAWRALRTRLATVNIADAVAISATNDNGLLRYNGRREQGAIAALERQVIDPSDEQSATAVLEKLTGAELVGVRQRQARTQFLVDIVEQLLIDTKRARDAEATALNMQITSWRDGTVANDAFVTGTGDALSSWRQP
jgi:hypothetical protein